MTRNDFESGAQKMLPAVLVYVESGESVLMIHRASRAGDIHSGKWNGLGGKMEFGENCLEAAHRELKEESGLDLPLQKFESRGVLHFPNFKAHKKEDWMVFLFWVKADKSVLEKKLNAISEGQPQWIEKTKLLDLNLWPGDKIFLPMLLAGQKILGTLTYDDGEVSHSWIEILST